MTDFSGRGEGGPLLARLRNEIKQAFERRDAAPLRLNAYQPSTLPPPARLRGHVVFIETTARPAYSDGAAWRYMDGSAV